MTPTKKRPAKKRKKGGKPGRKKGDGAFKPTQAQRDMVSMAVVIGMPERRLITAIINQETGKAITAVTLRKHFRAELDAGLTQVDFKVGKNLLALTETSAAAAIFFAKCRWHWRERAPMDAPQVPEAPPGMPVQTDHMTMIEIGRRIAFALSLAGELIAADAVPPPKVDDAIVGKSERG